MRTQRTTRLTVPFETFDGGIQEYTSLLVNSQNETPYAVNVYPSKPGVLSKCLGMAELGSVATADKVKGLAIYEKEDGTREVVKAVTTTLSRYSGGSWSSLYTSFTNNSTDKMEAVNAYIDDQQRLYMVTGHNDNLAYYNGSTVSAVTDVKAKHIAYFLNRIYIANCKLGATSYPIRVQWAPEGADTFDIVNDYFDDLGEPVTALKVYSNNLFVFGENSLAAFDGYALRFIPGRLGTTSARSVQVVNGKLVWYNRLGVYVFNGIAQPPILISKKIQGWIDAIADSSAVASGIDTYGRYFLYVGDVTYGGTLHSDVVLVYDEGMNSWIVETGKNCGCYATSASGGAFTMYGGSVDNAKVYTIHSGYSNAGNAIASEWRTPWIVVDSPEDIKNAYNLYLCIKGMNTAEYLTVQYRTNGSATWSNIEGTTSNVSLSGTSLLNTEELLLHNLAFKSVQFRITHSSSAAGFEMYKLQIEMDKYAN
jgi:hypothetical protein